MNLFKVFGFALLASVASGAPAPQQVLTLPAQTQFVTAAAAPTFTTLRAVQALPVEAATHTSHSITHTEQAAPAAIRFVQAAPQPATVVRTVAHAQPTVVRTVEAAQPATVHVEEQPATVSVVREIPAPAVSYAAAEQRAIEPEVEASPNYSFGYSVADTRSGDSKTREETREGDSVTGSYSVADPDGRIRRVTYTADKENGFRATVTYDGEAGPPAIPIDAPQTDQVVSVAAAPAQVAAAEEAVVIARDSLAQQQQPATIVRAIPAAASHVVRTAPATTQTAVHAIHNAPVQTTRDGEYLHT